MNDTLAIRTADSSDVNRIASLWEELTDGNAKLDARFERTSSARDEYARFIGQRLDQDEHHIIVAEVESHIVGYCCASTVKRPPLFKQQHYGFISDVIVTASHRRKGIASHLVRSSLSWLSERGCHRVELHALNASDAAVGFWKAMGFLPYMTTMHKNE